MRPVNLLPESQRRRQPAGGGKGAYAVLGVLGVLLLMTGVYVLTANTATSRTNEAAAVGAEADGLEAQVAALGSFGDFAQVKETRVASVRQLADARFDWERLMRELARVIPSGGWVQDVKASTAGSDDGGDSLAPAGSTTTLTGCLPRQSDVAVLMLRLRRMHRVTDVTLKESAIEDLKGVPSLDGCGRLYKFDVTATFEPAVVEEAPDGERRVPASLGGGS
jgi:Tfp pilus assembly protein PilN